MNMIQMIMM